jgi:hypothetical protein
LDTDDEKRRARRVGVLRSVRLVFERTAIECIVRDVSPTGVRIRLSQDVIVPEQVTLYFQKGEIISARRRWQRGHQAGFAFERTDSLVEESQELASRLLTMIRAASISEPMRLLRVVRFFDDPELQTEAERVEAGLRELETALAAVAARP